MADVLMPDVNVLVYAHRADDRVHPAYRLWLEALVNGKEPFALSSLSAVGFVRVVTNPRIYSVPTPLPIAIAAVEHLAGHPRCRVVVPGPGHLARTLDLCRATRAAGKLVADAEHAALAMSEGCTFVTRDADFSRFEAHGLRLQHLALSA